MREDRRNESGVFAELLVSNRVVGSHVSLPSLLLRQGRTCVVPDTETGVVDGFLDAEHVKEDTSREDV